MDWSVLLHIDLLTEILSTNYVEEKQWLHAHHVYPHWQHFFTLQRWSIILILCCFFQVVLYTCKYVCMYVHMFVYSLNLWPNHKLKWIFGCCVKWIIKLAGPLSRSFLCPLIVQWNFSIRYTLRIKGTDLLKSFVLVLQWYTAILLHFWTEDISKERISLEVPCVYVMERFHHFGWQWISHKLKTIGQI